MNTDQAKGVVRWLLAVISGMAVGWLAAANVLTPDQLQQVGSMLSSETAVSVIVAIIALVWGLLTHTTANTIKSAAKLPEVAQVELVPTIGSAKLKEKIGSSPEASIVVGRKVK